MIAADRLDLEVATVIDVEVGEPDEGEDVRVEDLAVAAVAQTDSIVWPGEMVEDVGCDGPLHDVEVVDVQQPEVRRNLTQSGC